LRPKLLIEICRRTEVWVQARRKFAEYRDAQDVDKMCEAFDEMQKADAEIVWLFDRLDSGYNMCSHCSQLLPPDAFYSSHDWCKKCISTNSKENYAYKKSVKRP
jgi:hypothetical protein